MCKALDQYKSLVCVATHIVVNVRGFPLPSWNQHLHRNVTPLPPSQVQVIQLEEESGEFILRSSFDHPYPTTKIMWIPDQTGQYTDLVATAGDYLRLWRCTDSEVRQECMLNNVSLAVVVFYSFLFVHYFVTNVCF